jgi:predicted transcriptional regulator YdeE
MRIEIVEIGEFQVAGHGVTTTLNDYGTVRNRAELFDNYFRSGDAEAIAKIAENPEEYYALAWLLDPGRQIRYFLGQGVTGGQSIPPGAELRKVAPATYAKATFAAGTNIEKVWTDFYYQAGSGSGYSPNYDHDVWFEHYPDGLNGVFELYIAVNLEPRRSR